MVFRSVRNPIYLGLGTAAITALSAAVPVAIAAAGPSTDPSAAATSPSGEPSAAGDSPSPDPSDAGQSPATAPNLFVVLSLPGTAVHSGDAVKISVHVYATDADAQQAALQLSVSSGGMSPKAVDLDEAAPTGVVNDAGKFISGTVTIPKSMTTGSVTVTAKATAPGAEGKEAQGKIAVTKRSSSSGGSNGGSNGGSGSSGGSTGGVGSGGVPGAGSVPSLPDPGFVPASPAGALQSPQVALPQIAPQAPGTPPTMAAAAPNTLRGGAPGAQELTFERLASTQAAWLAALLVAFSLLTTQLRLVRPYHARLTGDHRRPRHGLFQR